jgi:hypothetical protein
VQIHGYCSVQSYNPEGSHLYNIGSYLAFCFSKEGVDLTKYLLYSLVEFAMSSDHIDLGPNAAQDM